MSEEKETKLLKETRKFARSTKKDTNVLGAKTPTQIYDPLLARLEDLVTRDIMAAKQFIKSPLFKELYQILLNLEGSFTQELINICGKPDVTENIRGHVQSLRTIRDILTKVQELVEE